jgi:hypothetical protein
VLEDQRRLVGASAGEWNRQKAKQRDLQPRSVAARMHLGIHLLTMH